MAFFNFFKKFFKTPLWFALSQCELVKGLLIDSDKEQLFRCSLKIEYQVHRTSVLMISYHNGYAKTSNIGMSDNPRYKYQVAPDMAMTVRMIMILLYGAGGEPG